MPVSALAFSEGDGGTFSTVLAENCFATAFVKTDAGQEHAYSRLSNFNLDPPESQFAGGALYAYSTTPEPASSQLTTAFIAACIGVDASDVTGLSQTGPSVSFAEDTYIGYSFTLLNGTEIAPAGNYTIGTDGVSLPDTTPPSLSLTSTSSSPLNSSFTVQAKFSESVTGFTIGDVTVGNGEAKSLSGSGDTYTFTVEPEADGTVKVDVAADRASDAAGNGNTAASSLTRFYDATRPDVTLSSQDPSAINSAFTVKAEFSETVTGFGKPDVSVSNGTVTSVSGSGTLYFIEVSPSSDGTVAVSVPAGGAQDAAGNTNTAATELTRLYDGTKPEGEITSTNPDPTNSSPLKMTVEFSEEITGFSLLDISVSNGAAENLAGSGDSYTFDVVPAGQGAVSVGMLTGSVSDVAGNTNAAIQPYGISYDSVAPTLELTAVVANPTNSDTFEVKATFSEDVTGFQLDDIVVGNGAAKNLAGSGSVYTFDVEVTTDGDVTVDVAAEAAEDAAGNLSTAAKQLSRLYDGTAPTVSLQGPAKIAIDPFLVVATFSEDVTGLEISDIEIVGGQITDLEVQTPGTSVYHLTVEPVIGDDIAISIPADVAEDAAGNGNELSNTYAVEGLTVADVLAERENQVRDVMVKQMLGHLRQRHRRHSGMMAKAAERKGAGSEPLSGTLNFAANGQGYAGDGSINGVGVLGNGMRAVLEGEMEFSSTDGEDDIDSSYFYLRGALEKDLSAATMAGVFLEAEFASSEFTGAFSGSEDSNSLLAGAYVLHAFSDTLLGQAYASYGMGEHGLEMADDILSLSGDYHSESFELGAALKGSVDLGWATFAPELSMSYGETRIGELAFYGEAYGLSQNGLSLMVPTVTLARVQMAPTLDLPLSARDGASAKLSISPSLVCERYEANGTVEGCGYGLDLTALASKDGALRLSLSGEHLNGRETYSASVSVNYGF